MWVRWVLLVPVLVGCAAAAHYDGQGQAALLGP